MTDPAQVTEHVPGGVWAALGTLAGIAFTSIASVLTKRTETSAQVDTAHVEARVELEREDTARTRIEVDADKGAFERAFDAKAIEHRECIDEVRKLRGEFVDVTKALAKCEAKHETAEDKAEWFSDRIAELEALLGIKAKPAPRPRPPTPANGTDIVRPVARKDPRRDP